MKKSKKISKISLVTLRKAKGLSQRELASDVMISSSAIAQYESGSRNPTLENALKIANYFNVPVENISFESKK